MANQAHIVKVRRRVGTAARELGFGSTDQTRLMTAASELTRNALVHGQGGRAFVEGVRRSDGRSGLRLVVEDRGPGISDVDQALRDGFSSGRGLGLGLGGTRRMVDEFTIDSTPGGLTRVVMTKWLR